MLGPQSLSAEMNGTAAYPRHDHRLHRVSPILTRACTYNATMGSVCPLSHLVHTDFPLPKTSCGEICADMAGVSTGTSCAVLLGAYRLSDSERNKYMQGHAEHASSNGGVLTPNGHMMSLFLPFHAPGVPYHMAVPASHAELLRYHHLPAAASPYGFAPPVSLVNGHMYSGHPPAMYPLAFPGELASAQSHS